MHRFVLVLGLILAVACLAQAGIKGTGIALEAELAQRIEAPLKIDDDAVVKGHPTESLSGWKANRLLEAVVKVGPSSILTCPRKGNMQSGDMS